MMKKILSLFFLLASVQMLQAQSLLTLPREARSWTMGNSLETPAGFVLSDRTFSAAIHYTYFQPTKNRNHLPSISAEYRIGKRWSVDLDAGYFSFNSYDIIGADGKANGTFTPYQLQVAVGAGFRILDGLSIGAKVRYFHSALAAAESIPDYQDGNAVTADIALMYSIAGLDITAGVSDLGSNIRYGNEKNLYQRMPMMTRIGLQYSIRAAEQHHINIALQGNWYPYASGYGIQAGLEYDFHDYLFIRGGYYHSDGKMLPSYGSVGIGGRFAGVSLSGAYIISEQKSPLLNTFSITLSYDL